jgi:internalin A
MKENEMSIQYKSFRRLKYGLCLLLFLGSVCSIVSGCIFETEKQAVASITELGGCVTQTGGGRGRTSVELGHWRGGDEGLRHLFALNNVTSVSYDLRLVRGPGKGWAIYKGFLVSDDGLYYLGNIKTLESLSLKNTCISDEGIRHLSGLHNLRSLTLDKTNISDEGMAIMKSFPCLVSLFLAHTRITDNGLKEIATLDKMERLNVEHTSVSDVGLKYISSLINLKLLYLSGTSVTDEGIEMLKRELPQCKIIQE